MVADEYDYWLLDLDGTLVDVEDWYTYDVFDRVGDRIGYDFSQEQADILWHGLGGFRNHQLERWNIEPDAFWDAFHAEEDPEARAEATYLYDDAARFADIETPLGLVTHSQQYLADPVLDHLGIRDWFDAVVCCTEETGWKPDPEPVERALAGIEADGRGVLAGDGPQDVGAAWNAGLDGVHVERHGHERRGMCVRGDHRVESFDELFGD
ncbi:HAD family hydrolase [Halorarius halobius]|uniref:HAD family hydrolase n=1 Tax=Halorarius halobius TaxID=2962671 RepID=UPI0020CD8158|nr:HAD family hydrolase [Halorarius halobius]